MAALFVVAGKGKKVNDFRAQSLHRRGTRRMSTPSGNLGRPLSNIGEPREREGGKRARAGSVGCPSGLVLLRTLLVLTARAFYLDCDGPEVPLWFLKA